MGKNLSPTFVDRLHSLEWDGAPFLLLLTIENDNFSTYRFVNDVDDIVSRGNTFEAIQFYLNFPSESDERPEFDIQIDNIETDLIRDIRSSSVPCKVTVEGILSDFPDQLELAYSNFLVRKTLYSGSYLTLQCQLDDILEFAYPKGLISTAQYRGLS